MMLVLKMMKNSENSNYQHFHLWQLITLNADIADSLVYQPGRSNVRKPLDLQDHGPGQCTQYYYNVLEADFRALIKGEDGADLEKGIRSLISQVTVSPLPATRLASACISAFNNNCELSFQIVGGMVVLN